jgi:hypothetical protein
MEHVLVENLIVTQLIRHSPHFMEPDGLLKYSQEFASRLCSEVDEHSPHTLTLFMIHINIDNTREGAKVMPPTFFSENVISVTVNFTCMIHRAFAVMRLFFHKVYVTFSTLLPTLSKTLYASVAKLPTSAWEHVSKTLFQFSVICKMAST